MRRVTALVAAGALFTAAPEIHAGDAETGLIQVPIRWCAVAGSPAASRLVPGADVPGPEPIPTRALELPNLEDRADTNAILLRRLDRATTAVWLPGANIALRSAATVAMRERANFPVIADPNPPVSRGGTGPGALGDILLGVDPRGPTNPMKPETAFNREIKEARAFCLAAWDKLATDLATPLVGPIVVNLRLIVDSLGQLKAAGWMTPNTVPLQAVVCENLKNKHPMPADSNNPYGGVADNSVPLTSDFRDTLLARDPQDLVLAHELGHGMFLGHGNGLDDDSDGVFDAFCEVDENQKAPPLNLMSPNGLLTSVVTGPQKDVARKIALVSGAQHDPPGTLVNGNTVSDQRVDTVQDVADDAVDIVSAGMTENTVSQTTIFTHELFGMIPQEANNQYLVFADFDGNPATGGAPSMLGFPTGFQGAELVTRVVVRPAGGGTPGLERTAIPTVWKFQSGAFVEATDPQIRANVVTLIEAETEVPLSDVVSIQMPNSIRGASGTQVRIQAIAQAFGATAGGELDRLPDSPSDGVPLFMVPPQFPTAAVTLAEVQPGAVATVEANGLLPNRIGEVRLGGQLIAVGATDSAGNVSMRFIVPTDAKEGPQVITVGVIGTALTGVTSVTVAGSPVTPPVAVCGGQPATIVGSAGNDVLIGTPGSDVIAGLSGNDIIRGMGGNDVICGGEGNDVIIAGAGNDVVLGGDGNDALIAGHGDNVLDGGAGNDTLNSGDDNDVLIAGGGNDALDSGAGDDKLSGGSGSDACNGGPGTDTAIGCDAASNVP